MLRFYATPRSRGQARGVGGRALQLTSLQSLRWLRALELLESGHGFDVALLGFPHNEATRHHHRTHPVEGVRALVHGHRPVVEVERTGNQWNVDTRAGIPQLNRLSILEVGPELRSWTFDVDEARTCQTAQVEEEERHWPQTA